ncbi:MAG TPA: hypothetical protein V6C50_10645 [Crinalium sp.]
MLPALRVLRVVEVLRAQARGLPSAVTSLTVTVAAHLFHYNKRSLTGRKVD